VAGFFGLFFGNVFYHLLVVPDHFEWPFSKVNASFIAAFYRKTPTAYVAEAEANAREASTSIGVASELSAGSSVTTDKMDKSLPDVESKQKPPKKAAKGDLKVFLLFFAVAFLWFPIPNYFVPALFTMSFLCWGPHSWSPVQPFGRGGLNDAVSVLGSGEAGAGIPGLGG